MSKFTDEEDVSETTPFTADEEKAEQFDQHRLERRYLQARWMSSPLWCLSSLVLAVLLAVQTLYNAHWSSDAHNHASGVIGSYETGFDTEFSYQNPAIKLHSRVRFQNGLREDENGTINPFFHDSSPRYTTSGATHEEADQAWLDLINHRYVRLTESEIEWLKTDEFQGPLSPINDNSDGKEHFFAGPEMLHSLHCVDSFRKWTDTEHYGDDSWEPGYRMHVNHCIDQLRQGILCHGDMTPVTMRPVFNEEGRIRAYLGETERTHTCRDGLALGKRWQQRALEIGWLGMSKEDTAKIGESVAGAVHKS